MIDETLRIGVNAERSGRHSHVERGNEHIMEAAQPGLRAVLQPEWRSGVTCRVLQSGAIQRGDAVTIAEKT